MQDVHVVLVVYWLHVEQFYGHKLQDLSDAKMLPFMHSQPFLLGV
jgi:hypothetical protein